MHKIVFYIPRISVLFTDCMERERERKKRAMDTVRRNKSFKMICNNSGSVNEWLCFATHIIIRAPAQKSGFQAAEWFFPKWEWICCDCELLAAWGQGSSGKHIVALADRWTGWCVRGGGTHAAHWCSPSETQWYKNKNKSHNLAFLWATHYLFTDFGQTECEF